MVESKSTAKPLTLDVRTAPATKAIAERLEAQKRRIYQAVGTVETVMHVLTEKFDDSDRDDELTPLWSALTLALDTLNDVAEQLGAPPVVLEREVAHG